MTIQETYLNGITLARYWRDQAIIDKQPIDIVAMYDRILDGAIHQYMELFLTKEGV